MSAAGDTLRCFGWSQRAWARPWRAFARHLAQQATRQRLPAGTRWPQALELGAGPRSSLAPLLLAWADTVDCSYFESSQRAPIERWHAQHLSAAQRARIGYSQRDVRALHGRWDLIVMKSVLGGVCRTHNTGLADLHALLHRLRDDHLKPGGWLVSLDNGRTALEPLLAPFGARRNGWRFLARQDFPAADFAAHFGVLSAFSAATRLGALGQGVDNALYAADCLLSPLARQHAVHLHAWQKPASSPAPGPASSPPL
ncbi:MAG: hypothetical protein Q4F13_11720 [Pseudomonadota bacterium]|nr:hypothetical protein [Pseudomonadota bacterium]